MTVPIMYNYRSICDKFPTKYNFSHFTPQVRLFFVEKRKRKIFGFKNVRKRGTTKILTFVKTLNCIENFRECNAVAEPNLDKSEGVGGGRRSRKKTFFALWASVWSKNKGRPRSPRSPRPLLWICHCLASL